MGSAPTWLRQVIPPLLQMSTLTTDRSGSFSGGWGSSDLLLAAVGESYTDLSIANVRHQFVTSQRPQLRRWSVTPTQRCASLPGRPHGVINIRQMSRRRRQTTSGRRFADRDRKLITCRRVPDVHAAAALWRSTEGQRRPCRAADYICFLRVIFFTPAYRHGDGKTADTVCAVNPSAVKECYKVKHDGKHDGILYYWLQN